ncbi:hypothetical protein FHR83_002447 [Actinoplanes campanulatus]|uniref:DUF4331 domain-containing protein n=1 Tax=Actinoplanes campanulatus TaxID=113559 RepID=A0A7W5AFF2_9ACTN|nr:DUF4331 domain-containing protein [Actinoplanes campanulatus]MBB3094784.1 hypothetical protein [Actinoplanes campanulatus]GGN07413.1 hypothetical protein GCM10010109_15720 [Actinoplanes campanulatus]GID36078.1 hypothetical protein Aca09nite_25840 [Actinoplanes campanulatus]
MSSHREAPEISKDPVADSSDLYAFVSPDDPDTVTIIANYVPLQIPASGPNFFEFGDDVLYEIHIDANGDARPDITYQFRFRTELRNDKTFLYNTGQIKSLDDENWNRRQFYSVTKVDAHGKSTVLANKLQSPPCNVGKISIPDYDKLAEDAVHKLKTGEKVFAGQRADAFFVDLGAIFDLGTLRPFQDKHLVGSQLFNYAGKAVNATDKTNVHSIAIQIPLHMVRRDGKKRVRAKDAGAVIGVWTSASRRQVEVRGNKGDGDVVVGPQVQVSRLGNPLFNEVIVPMAEKDKWNSLPPSEDKRFAEFVATPELGALLPVLYPGLFDKLAALNKTKEPRADLLAILLTGIPDGLIDGFQNNTGALQADMLRLNTAIEPAAKENKFGLLGGDLAGFPNGRRVADDVVSISLRAIAGVTVPLVNADFEPDAAAALVEQGLSIKDASAGLLKKFPFLGTPFDGFGNPS